MGKLHLAKKDSSLYMPIFKKETFEQEHNVY